MSCVESLVYNMYVTIDPFNYRYLIKYNATLPGHKTPVTLESQYSYRQHYKVLNPVGPIGRLVSLEVGHFFSCVLVLL